MTISTGPNFPSTTADKTYSGGITWQGTSDIVSDNGIYSTSNVLDHLSSTNWITAKNFGFSLPSTAVPIGMQAQIKINTDYGMFISGDIKANILNTSDNFYGTEKTLTNQSWYNDQIYTFGGSSDDWGSFPFGLPVNNPLWGVGFRFINKSGGIANVKVDYVKVTVWYRDIGVNSISVSYGSYTKTGPNNTPFTLSFNAGTEVTQYQIRTGTGGGSGTLVQSGSASSGSNIKTIPYNAPGLTEGEDQRLYLRTGDGTNWSETTFTYSRDDMPATDNYNVPPFRINHVPDPVPTTKQYVVKFKFQDLYPSTNSLSYIYSTGSGGTGTVLATGTFSSNVLTTTPTITDSALVDGTQGRHLTIIDPANNRTNSFFYVTANILEKNLTGSIGSMSGNVTKRTSKTMTGVFSATGNVFKRATRSITGTMGTLSATLATVKVYPVNLTGTVGALSGTLSRSISKTLTGPLSPTGLVQRAGMPVRLVGSITMSGSVSVSRFYYQSISGAITSITGSVATTYNKFRHAIMGAGNIVVKKMKGGSDS